MREARNGALSERSSARFGHRVQEATMRAYLSPAERRLISSGWILRAIFQRPSTPAAPVNEDKRCSSPLAEFLLSRVSARGFPP